MNEPEGGLRKWVWGLAAPIVLTAIAVIWLGMGEVTLTGRSGATTYRGWGLLACAAAPFFLGLRLHAECFLETLASAGRWGQWVSVIAGWMLALALAGCVAWIASEVRP